MGKFINYHEEAKRVFLELNRDNISSEEKDEIDPNEYKNTFNSLLALSEVVNTQYSEDVIKKKGRRLFQSRDYFEAVIDQLYIFLNNTMNNPVIGIKKEVMSSKEVGYKIISKLEDLLEQ